MSKTVKAAWITGVCTVIGAIISGILVYYLSGNSNTSVSVNVSQISSLSSAVTRLEDENSLLREELSSAIDLLNNYREEAIPNPSISEKSSQPDDDHRITESPSSSTPKEKTLLAKMDYFNTSSNDYPLVSGDEFTDNFSNTYTNYLSHYLFAKRGEPQWNEYYLHSMYTKLEGKLVLNYLYRGENNYNAWVKIYSDDELVYSSPKMQGGAKIQDISLDLTGVEILKVEFYTDLPDYVASASAPTSKFVALVDCYFNN